MRKRSLVTLPAIVLLLSLALACGTPEPTPTPTPTPCPEPSDVVGWAAERVLEEVERVTDREIHLTFSPELLETLFDSATGVYTYRGEFTLSLGPVDLTKTYTVNYNSNTCALSMGILDLGL